jgi:dihydroorotate dehydrogenase electron transfer subunit
MLKDSSAPIIGKEEFGSHVRLTLKSPAIAREALPGQFVMVKVSDTGCPLLRRPLCVHARRGETIALYFDVVGFGTGILAQKKHGESLDLIGPLGRGFSVGPPEGEDEVALLVGGGRGIAPLYYLADALHGAGFKVRVLYGCRTAEELKLRRYLEEACWESSFATDDGSCDFPGTVTGLLEKELEKDKPVRIYACGPEPMLQEVSRQAKLGGIPAELSLESRMGCGFGACWGCVRKIRRGGREEWVKVCEEGPVFQAEDVVWD